MTSFMAPNEPRKLKKCVKNRKFLFAKIKFGGVVPDDDDDGAGEDEDVGGGDEELVPQEALDVGLVHQGPGANPQHRQSAQLQK